MTYVGRLDMGTQILPSEPMGGKMKIDFNKPFMTIEKDKEIQKPDATGVFTLKDAALNSLLLPDDKLTGEEKAKRYILATRISANPTGIDLELEELVKIKELIGKVYGPLIVGQAWEILEGRNG